VFVRALFAAGGRAISDQNPQKAAFDRALALLQRGDAAGAEQACVDALSLYPEDVNLLCLSARALLRVREFAAAEARLRKALSLFPDFPRPHEILGELLLLQKKPAQAIDAFRHALHLGSDDGETYEKLGTALVMQGRTDEAEDVAEESRRRNPVRAASIDALQHVRNGNPDEAERIYQTILVREPDNVEALAGIGSLAVAKKQFTDAEIFLQRAVDRAPDFLRAWADLVIAQMELEKYDEAVATAGQLLRLDAGTPMSHLLLGNAYAMSGRHQDALREYREVAAQIPGDPGALSGMAHMLKTIGRQDESIAAYKTCIRDNPQHTEAWWGLANMKTYRFANTEIETMQELLQTGTAKAEPTSRWLTSTPEVNLCNALGIAFERNGDYERAFAYFERGNNKRRLDEPYDPVYVEHLHDRIIAVFSQDFLDAMSGLGDNSAAAIFIVGLPRTGSTLIEQIIASHSDVDGTHELPELGQLARSLPVVDFKNSRYPETVLGLGEEALASLGAEYIERTRRYRSGKAHFTDKNLGNFMHIGLLQLILPNASIIHARRHPLDTCLGCYKQLFARGQSYSYDLEELGEYYLQYRRLMDHWDTVLPGKVLHVDYENIVADVETESRRILAHCGLSWDARCLRFFETPRDVRTASSEQVRQPIYRSSVNLWRHYEAHLGELIDVLEPELMKLPMDQRPVILRDENVT